MSLCSKGLYNPMKADLKTIVDLACAGVDAYVDDHPTQPIWLVSATDVSAEIFLLFATAQKSSCARVSGTSKIFF